MVHDFKIEKTLTVFFKFERNKISVRFRYLSTYMYILFNFPQKWSSSLCNPSLNGSYKRALKTFQHELDHKWQRRGRQKYIIWPFSSEAAQQFVVFTRTFSRILCRAVARSEILGGLVVLGGYNVSPLVITKYMLSIGSGPKMFGALNRQFYVKIFHLHYIKSPIFRVI